MKVVGADIDDEECRVALVERRVGMLAAQRLRLGLGFWVLTVENKDEQWCFFLFFCSLFFVLSLFLI